MSKISTLKKPSRAAGAALAFSEAAAVAPSSVAKGAGQSASENAPMGQKSGLVPTGDVRLTANIRQDLHTKLKIRAAQERTTVGELIEQWIEGWS